MYDVISYMELSASGRNVRVKIEDKPYGHKALTLIEQIEKKIDFIRNGFKKESTKTKKKFKEERFELKGPYFEIERDRKDLEVTIFIDDLLGMRKKFVINLEKDEDDLVLNLQSLEHSKKIKRVHRLEDCLRYFDTRHEYVYELLRHLYSILKSEGTSLLKLKAVKELRKYRKVVSHLKSEFEVEQTLLRKIEDIEELKEKKIIIQPEGKKHFRADEEPIFEIDFNFVVFNTYLRGDEIIIH
ncbi:MAG: hypothetical protein IIA06_12845 [Proteobacteria bacterium]|nr:hypothetical protein [Pseudomonadota bacterium]